MAEPSLPDSSYQTQTKYGPHSDISIVGAIETIERHRERHIDLSPELYAAIDVLFKAVKGYERMLANALPTKKHILRFWSFVRIRTEPDACWEWQGVRNRYGYGKFGVKLRWYIAHRYAFKIANGYEPFQFVLHSCDNRACCNPNHLREGTFQENQQDAIDRNRILKGERNGRSRLTEEQVLCIRREVANGVMLTTMAKRFGVSTGAIDGIIHRRTWKHI